MIKILDEYMRISRKVLFLLISTVFLCNGSLYALNNLKDTSITCSKEQIDKQNILTLFRWIEAGNLDKTEAKNAIVVIKKQLMILRKECALGKRSCAAVYGYMDNAFFNTFTDGYEFMGNNRPLLNRLFVEAAKEANTADPRHPWLDIKGNLLDCLENEAGICCGTFTSAVKTDLTKPEIFVAPSIDSVVNLVEGSFSSILKTQVSLSGAYRLVHSGSTSRGTSLDNTDFDFDLIFEKQKDLDIFSKRLPLILNSLSRKWKSEGYNILSKNGGSQYSWGRLISLFAQNKDGIFFRVQVVVDRESKLYSDCLNAQIEQIKTLGGSWDNLKGQIILFKNLVRGVLHSYKKSYGGLDGMECEQFILQPVSSSEFGRKITGIGSFDKTMRWIYKIGFDRTSSAIIPFNTATDQGGIYYINTGEYKQIVCTPLFWAKLVNAARKYVALAKTEMSEDEFASLGY